MFSITVSSDIAEGAASLDLRGFWGFISLLLAVLVQGPGLDSLLSSFLIAVIDNLKAILKVLVVKPLIFCAESTLVLVDPPLILSDFGFILVSIVSLLSLATVLLIFVLVLTRKFDAKIILNVGSRGLLALASAADLSLSKEAGSLSRLALLLLFLFMFPGHSSRRKVLKLFSAIGSRSLDLSLFLVAHVIDLVQGDEVVTADSHVVPFPIEARRSSAELNVARVVALRLVFLTRLRAPVLLILLDHVIGLDNVLFFGRVVLLLHDFVADVGRVVQLIIRGVLVAIVGFRGRRGLLGELGRLGINGRGLLGAGGRACWLFILLFVGCRVFGFLLLLLEKGLESLFLFPFRHVCSWQRSLYC